MILINHGAEPFAIARGDRVAQLVLAPVVQAALAAGAHIVNDVAALAFDPRAIEVVARAGTVAACCSCSSCTCLQ